MEKYDLTNYNMGKQNFRFRARGSGFYEVGGGFEHTELYTTARAAAAARRLIVRSRDTPYGQGFGISGRESWCVLLTGA